MTWRMDRDLPLDAEPEFFTDQAAAEARLWRLEMSGFKGRAIVWDDLAAYEGGECA